MLCLVESCSLLLIPKKITHHGIWGSKSKMQLILSYVFFNEEMYAIMYLLVVYKDGSQCPRLSSP